MAGLLDQPTPEQQRLLDLVAEGFLLDGEWPIFDYVEGTFDQSSQDAAASLASFPRVGRWNYGAVWWVGLGQASKPSPETELALTIIGLHHSNVLQPLVDVFFASIALMVERRRSTRPARRMPRQVTITNTDVEDLLKSERRLDTDKWPLLLFKVIQREPSFLGGASVGPEGQWTMSVPREVDAYEGVSTVEDYIAQLARLTATAPTPMRPAAPSPLDLVAAMDYLDAVWRVRHSAHLFNFPSAERTAKLTYPANTTDELDSRLSALGEILRTANKNANTIAKAKLTPASRESPLAPLRDHLVSAVDETAQARVGQAVTELEHALAMRDAAQHAEAGDRAVRALDAFGIGHPVVDVAATWQTVTTRVVEALGAIRDELASTSP